MTATLSSLTGIDVGNPQMDVLDIKVTEVSLGLEVSVTGRFQRTGGPGSGAARRTGYHPSG